MDIIKTVIRIEADTIGGKSKVFLNGVQLSQKEIEQSEILYDIAEDDTYSLINVSPLDQCYKKINGQGVVTYIAYGNLNEKDECNRRLAFSTLLEATEINDNSLLNVLSVEFQKIGYTFIKKIYPEQPTVPHKVSVPKANNPKPNKASFGKLILILIAIIFFIILAIIIL